MFLSDRTRRFVCSLLWLLFGLAPSVLVVGWCIWRNTPYDAQAAADALSREMGLRVTLARLTHAQPGATRIEGLQLVNPENGQAVFRCRAMDVTWTTAPDSQGQIRRWLTLDATSPELSADGLEELVRTLQHVMQSRTSLAEPRVRLSLGTVPLRSAEGTQTLNEVTCQVEATPGGVQSQMSFRLADLAMPEPARIGLARNRQTTPPTLRFDFSTGGAPLPCNLLTAVVPELGKAGPNSRFLGWLWASRMPDGWQGELAGQISQIDLDGLVSDWSSHKFSGTAQLSVQIARFRRGRLEEIAGVLSSGPGVISRSLLAAAVERLGLTRGGDPSTPGDLVPYEQMAIAFLLNRQGLRVQGGCPTGGVGSILVDRYTRLLCDPPVQPIPAAALVQTLAPFDSLLVSANRQSQQLLQLLPLPDAAPIAIGATPSLGTH
jgi:hypothetical protein